MSEVFRFDDFELDSARFELRRQGTALEVQPKVLRLLQYLIQHRHRAVASDELLRELWPEATVGAGSLRRAVLGARSVLGDRGDSNESIRTVRGLGYQFARTLKEAAVAVEPPAPPPPAAVSGRPKGLPFLGREPVLASLLGMLDETLQGQLRCLLLSGSPGIGKTRTAEELWYHARRRGAQTWLGRCTDVGGVPALWPLLQVLRDALRDRGADELGALMGSGRADIARALPDLARTWPELGEAPAGTSESERFRLFESVVSFLRNAAARHPIVLGFDDLHRADSAMLQLLVFIVRQLDRVPIWIVGTYRSELAESREAERLLAALAREERTRCVELEGFDRETIRSYLATAVGSAPPEFALRALQEQTAGNPLFVRQLVERWQATDASLDWQTLAHVSHGLDLRGAIQRHLEVVPEAARELLAIASVLGREFSSALLSRVIEQPIEPVWLALSHAQSAQLIEPAGDHGRFRFTHSLIRDALYRQLPVGERARLHGQAARALEAQGIGSNYVLLAEVTRHFACAAPAHDGGLALSYTLRAAEAALGRLAYEEAAAHFERAIQLREYAAPDPRERMTLLFRKGAALARTTELEAARQALFEAVSLAREHGAAEMLYQAATLIASHPETGMVDRAQVAALRDALAALPESDERRALLQAALAKSLVYASDPAERIGLAEVALRSARAIRDLQLRAAVLTRCHEALIEPEHLRARVKISAELLELAREQVDPAALLRAFQTQIETSLERGDMAAVDTAVATMETLAERIREPFFRWHAKAIRGTQALIAGRPGEAERLALETHALGSALGEKLARHMYCTQVVGLYQLQGRVSEAEPLAREMMVRHPGVRGWVARGGVIDALLGRREQARRCFDELMARGLDWILREPFALSGLCTVADLCGFVRDEQGARALYRALLPYAGHYGLTHLGAATYGPVTRYLGNLAELQGQSAVAEAHYLDALERTSAMGSPTFGALTGAAYAHLLLRSAGAARRSDAIRVLHTALEQAERCELHGISGFLQALARRHEVHGRAPREAALTQRRGEA